VGAAAVQGEESDLMECGGGMAGVWGRDGRSVGEGWLECGRGMAGVWGRDGWSVGEGWHS
jgi:hypothetical protein